MITRITPCLWFDHQAEEAARHYCSIFPNSRIIDITRYGNAGHEIHGRPPGSVMTVSFELEGTTFTALNGGPHFTFTEAISLEVHCETQEEVDLYWDRLGTGGGGTPSRCGWLKDRYGLSWQIVPAGLSTLMQDPDQAKAERVMEVLLQMDKLDIRALVQAHEGKGG